MNKQAMTRVVKKARATETSRFDIIKVAMKACDPSSSDAAAHAAAMLAALFKEGRLDASHTDALDALGMLLVGNPELGRRMAICDVGQREYTEVPRDVIDVDVAIRLLTASTFACEGLEAITIVAYRAAPQRLRDAHAAMTPSSRMLVDAARVRAGENLGESELAEVLDWWALHGMIGVREDGYLTQVTTRELERSVPHVPTAAWSAALARVYSKAGHSNVEMELSRFTPAQLVSVVLGPSFRLTDANRVADLVGLEITDATGLWTALAGPLSSVDRAFDSEVDCKRSILACHGVLASVAEGSEVPAVFDDVFGPFERGMPYSQTDQALIVEHVYRALRLLPVSRAASIGRRAATLTNEARGKGRTGFHAADAILAANAAGDRDVIEAIAAWIPTASASVRRVVNGVADQ